MSVLKIRNLWNSRSGLWYLVIIGWLISAVPATAQQPQPQKKRFLTLGKALSASQRNRPEIEVTLNNGEKGLLQQQPVIDLLRGRRELQIALVLDGTDSMGRDLDSLKDGLSDFIAEVNKRRQGLVTQVAVVVYRDFNGLSGATTVATPEFLFANDPALAGVLSSIKTETGAPRFPEQVDRGLHAALTKLDWSSSENVAKSIILAGDAPPFDESEVVTKVDDKGLMERVAGFNAKKASSLRAYPIDQLITLAKEKKVSIFSVICNAGFLDRNDPDLEEVARLQNPLLERFAQQLASETGGAVLNLANTHTVDQFLGQANELDRLVELKPVQAADVETRRKEDVVRIAVLPPLALKQLKKGIGGWPQTDAYTFACTAVNRLEDVDSRGVVKMSPRLWDNFSLVYNPADGGPADQSEPKIGDVLKALASADKLDLDFIVWGNYSREGGTHRVELSVFDRNGIEVAKTGSAITANSITGLVLPALEDLAKQLQEKLAASPAEEKQRGDILSKLFAGARQVDSDRRWNDQLLEGYQFLEDAAALELKDPKSVKLNQQALAQFKEYLAKNKTDPLALLLLSSCERNLQHATEADEALKLAFEHREAADPKLKLEIEADHALFNLKDPAQAVTKYEELVRLNEKDLHVYSKQALRAKWMLSGLYLGGWGFVETKEFQNQQAKYLDSSRQLLLDILVYWPDSPEAEYYSRYIEPRPIRRPRRDNQKRQITFQLPSVLTPPKNGGTVASRQ